jgi:hypothetical protein
MVEEIHSGHDPRGTAGQGNGKEHPLRHPPGVAARLVFVPTHEDAGAKVICGQKQQKRSNLVSFKTGHSFTLATREIKLCPRGRG